MIIGVDFDNTIVCYDGLFHRAALDLGWIPAALAPSKEAVRDSLQARGRNQDWTVLQGIVYGTRMAEAVAFPGVIPFFRACRRAGVRTVILSHKSRTPALGEPHDLHAAAQGWLERNGFYDSGPDGLGLTPAEVRFLPTRAAKVEAIAAARCTHFIDDLPEVFAEAAFPASVERHLFDPGHAHSDWRGGRRVAAWDELLALLLPA